MKLLVIIASTRPGRVGAAVSEWFEKIVKLDKRFEVSVADLLKIDLPFLDEPNHPAMQLYTKDHTKKWSKTIEATDAFVIITPEYNFSAPASLINALDYLYKEWNYKAVGYVSYGGMSGGMRSVEHIKHLTTTLKMVSIYEAVNIPFVSAKIKDGKFIPDEHNEKAAEIMLDEIFRWSNALKTLRVSSKS